MSALTKDYTDTDLVDYVMTCYREAEMAKTEREYMNEANYDAYHMRHDFSHKEEGMSTETFSKVRMAVEQTKSFFQQSLADMNDGWFSIEPKNCNEPVAAMMIKPYEVHRLLAHYLKKAHYFKHVGSCVQRGLLEALMTSKIYGKMVPSPKFIVKKNKKGKKVVKKEDKDWQLCFERVRAANWFPDPNGDLYVIEESYIDYHVLKQKAREGMYNVEKVNKLTPLHGRDGLDDYERRKETGQNDSGATAHRPQIKLVEYWGDLVTQDGDLIAENIVCTVANDTELIRTATPNPLWHQRRPYLSTPLITVDGSTWHIALMDAPVRHNHAYTELYNLIMDAAFKQVHALSQIRVQDLANAEQISDGIKPGTKLAVKSSLPPGVKVMEPVEEVIIPNDAFQILNLQQQEFNTSALTNDLRQGVLPQRQVKATEIVEASQTITSIFEGMTKNIEAEHIVHELEMAWITIAQNWDKINKDTFIALFGPDRASELYGMDPQDVFVSTVTGFKYNVFGITQTLAKAQDFQKLTTALQTIGTVQVLAEPFLQKFDPEKILVEIMKALNIDIAKIQIDPAEQERMAQQQQQQMMPQGGAAAGPGMAPSMDNAPGPLASVFGAGAASSGFNGSY